MDQLLDTRSTPLPHPGFKAATLGRMEGRRLDVISLTPELWRLFPDMLMVYSTIKQLASICLFEEL